MLGTEQGSVQVHSSLLSHFGIAFSSSLLHAGEVTRLLTTPDGKYLLSSGADGTIFVIQLHDQTLESSKSIESAHANHQGFAVIDDQLAQIVLVRKSLMDHWRKRQENLKVEMEEENNKVESSLRHEKYKYEQQIA